MANFKANHVKRGKDAGKRAKAPIRYIAHRRDREGEKVARTMSGFEGFLTKHDVYRMIDAATQKRRYFSRFVLSPAPKREESNHDGDMLADGEEKRGEEDKAT